MAEPVINWTDVYADMFVVPDLILTYRTDEVVKPCRIIPCPGSYFPCHDEQCEMFWDEEGYAWTDCQCEPRAAERRDNG